MMIVNGDMTTMKVVMTIIQVNKMKMIVMIILILI